MSRDAPASWEILTGEYPPQPGGIADYTRLVARGLAERGRSVRIWAPAEGAGPGQGPGQGGASAGEDEPPGVDVRRVAGGWSRAGLAEAGRGLDRIAGPRRLLVQYVPNIFSRLGLNFGLARWLVGRRRLGDSVRLMFHEVTYQPVPGDSLARRALAIVQRRVVAGLLRAAGSVDVAIPYWERLLRPIDPDPARLYAWRPVPSNVPVVADPAAVAEARRRALPEGASTLIGTFGTFAPDLAAMLEAAFVPLLVGRPDRAALLIGRGGGALVDRLTSEDPGLAGRVSSTGLLDPAGVSAHLRACDLLIQPYPDGVSTKRGSMMAGIGNGVPVATNLGEVTEPIWAESGGVALAVPGRGPDLPGWAEVLLADPRALARLGPAGRDLYEARFALRHTVSALIDHEAGSPDR